MGTDIGLPVHGSRQTAQRAEVNAIAEAVARTYTPIHVVTDDKYVKDTATRIIDDNKDFWGKNGDLWNFVSQRKDRITGITGIKSHMRLAQALNKGFLEEDWELNHRADKLATHGANSHDINHTQDDQARYKLARKVQRCLLREQERQAPMRLALSRGKPAEHVVHRRRTGYEPATN